MATVHSTQPPTNLTSQLPPPRPTADIPPGARRDPPQIGIQIHASPHPPTFSAYYDAQIMHQPIPPTLEDVTATTDASVSAIAATFNIPVAAVATHWLTSRSPMELPGYDRRVTEHPVPTRHVPLSLGALQKHRELVAAVTAKLAAYTSTKDEAGEHGGVEQRPSRKLMQQELDRVGVAAPRHEPMERKVRVVKGPRPNCGFSQLSTHAQLSLAEDRRCVRKESGGLYRVSQGCMAASGCYAEFVVVELGGEGGLTVGVAPSGHALNRLAGSDGRSAGLHASGMIVTKQGEWKRVCRGLKVGDVVGIAVGRDVEFFLNGELVGQVGLVGVEELKFVACLYKCGAEVRLRCCSSEWEYFEEAEKRVEGLKSSCVSMEELEAGMSSISVASGSEGAGWKNRPSPRQQHVDKDCSSCDSVLTP